MMLSMNYFHATLLVLKDLFRHACGETVSLIIPKEPWSDKHPSTPLPVDLVPVRDGVPQPHPAQVLTTPVVAVSNLSKKASDPLLVTNFHEAYVSVVSACVYTRPVVAFDECTFVVPYATTLKVDRHEGRFSHVSHAGQVGWILKDEVTQVRTDIFPVCTPGVTYDAYHGTTIAIRRLINDEFRAGELFLPLQSVEYVTYKLLQQGRPIMWPNERPREPGTWHRLLRGLRGIQTDSTPHTGAIMEWYEGSEGCVAYTDIVRPNGSVVVSYVATTPEGQCIEREMTPADYHGKGALWIQIK